MSLFNNGTLGIDVNNVNTKSGGKIVFHCESVLFEMSSIIWLFSYMLAYLKELTCVKHYKPMMLFFVYGWYAAWPFILQC